jgi:hypothetical protein
VNCATADGTATAGEDYIAANETLNWADGDSTSRTFTINLVNDFNAETNETVNLVLSASTGILHVRSASRLVGLRRRSQLRQSHGRRA